MIKFFSNLRNSGRGFTIIEFMVSIVIIAILIGISIYDFPRIQKQFALSGATYRLAQDTRSAEDLALSGVSLKDVHNCDIKVKGYGVYVGQTPATQYLIYADINGNQVYDDGSSLYCNKVDQGPCPEADQPTNPLTSDCVLEAINVSKENPSLIINGTPYTSINFSPPNPIVKITGSGIIILGLSNGSSLTKSVEVNSSGLINVQ